MAALGGPSALRCKGLGCSKHYIAVSYQLSAVSSQQKSCNHCNRAFVTVLTLTGSGIFYVFPNANMPNAQCEHAQFPIPNSPMLRHLGLRSL
ncbi:MAG: hypothetical protein F6J93_35385 [Oscillatoria sp. SIO1A7]|nr:hypothetical protein [Oscillatoria sp. SIO1A7]